MKIAITADIHLKTNKEYPERLNALKNILDQLVDESIASLIIAGDLFDLESQNYSLFDELCRQNEYRNIEFYIIPGNHDPSINARCFTADNIRIFSEPTIQSFGDTDFSFFFVPYLAGISMGEVISRYRKELEGQWILVGHGDYLSGIRNQNTYEKGIYMPLGRSDIEYYNPSRVILGHIHKMTEAGRVYYPGSPCPMDINETGRRSFLLMDLSDLSITARKVNTDFIYLNEKFVVMPIKNEFESIRYRLRELVDKWNLSKEEISRARVRFKVRGYTSDKKQLLNVLRETLSDFTFYDDKGPDLSEVSLFDDPERTAIVERVKDRIDSLQDDCGYTESKRELILEQALGIILKE